VTSSEINPKKSCRLNRKITEKAWRRQRPKFPLGPLGSAVKNVDSQFCLFLPIHLYIFSSIHLYIFCLSVSTTYIYLISILSYFSIYLLSILFLYLSIYLYIYLPLFFCSIYRPLFFFPSFKLSFLSFSLSILYALSLGSRSFDPR
jgi:hypothetical protein